MSIANLARIAASKVKIVNITSIKPINHHWLTSFTTIMHAVNSQTVDMLLALLLIIGGVVGAQVGAQISVRLQAEQLRILLALLVLAVCFKIALDLLLQPSELFSITPLVLP